MNYLIFVFISLIITKVLCQDNQNDIAELITKNVANPNLLENADVLSLLQGLDLKSINSSLDLPSLIENFGKPELANNLNLTSILKNVDVQAAIKNGDAQSIVNALLENKSLETKLANIGLDTDLINKNKNLPVLVEPVSQNLDLTIVDEGLKPESENKGLDDQAGKKTLELPPENQNLENKPENENLENKPENENLENQSENENLEYQNEDQNMDIVQYANDGMDYEGGNQNVENQPENQNSDDTGLDIFVNSLNLSHAFKDTFWIVVNDFYDTLLQLNDNDIDTVDAVVELYSSLWYALSIDDSLLDIGLGRITGEIFQLLMKNEFNIKNLLKIFNLESEYENLNFETIFKKVGLESHLENISIFRFLSISVALIRFFINSIVFNLYQAVDFQSILKNVDLGSVLGNADEGKDAGPLSILKNVDLGSVLGNADKGKDAGLGSLMENAGLGSLTENADLLGSLMKNADLLGSLMKNADLGSLTNNFDPLSLLMNPALGSLSDNPIFGSVLKTLMTNPEILSLLMNFDLQTFLTKPDLGLIMKIASAFDLGSIFDSSQLTFVSDLMGKVQTAKAIFDNPWEWMADYTLPSGISLTCQRQVQAMLRDMAQVNGLPSYLKNWGFQMIDSAGKIPAGLTTGNVLWFGNIIECLSTKIPADNLIKNEESIGEFCMVNLYPNFTGYSDIDIRWAFCSPQACSVSDKLTFISYYADKMNIRANIQENTCQTKDTVKMDSTATQLTVLLMIPIVLVTLATLIDAFFSVTSESSTNHNNSVFAIFCKLFSAIPAFNYLFSSEENEKKESLDFMFGIRAIFIFAVLWLSVIREAMEENPWKSPLNINEIVKRPFVSLMSHQNIVMNNILFLSGFWLSFSIFRNKIFRHFSIFSRFILRYIRITVPYLYVITFISGPFLYYVTSPAYPLALSLRNDCRDSWFEKILYLAKFTGGFKPDKCVIGEWYLAVEMQLYLLALPLVFLLMWKPKVGLQGLFLVFFISTLALISIIMHDKKYLFTSVSNQLYYETNEKSHYFNPQSGFRAASSILGIFLGYLMIEYKHKFQLSKGFAIFTKLLVPVTMIITYIFNSNYIDENLMPTFLQIFYATFWNFFCHFVLACIIIVCYFNPNDFFNQVLSSNWLLPIGKLSVAMYLVNGELMKGRLIIRKDPLYLSYDQLKLEYLTLLTCSFMAAAVIFFAVESPLYRIMKKIFPTPNTNINSQTKLVKV